MLLALFNPKIVDLETALALNHVCKTIKMDMENLLDNCLSLLEKQLTETDYDIFEDMRLQYCAESGIEITTNTLILDIVINESFAIYPTAELQVSDAITNKLDYLRLKINRASQYKYVFASDEDQWDNPAYATILNRLIIQSACTQYMCKLLNIKY